MSHILQILYNIVIKCGTTRKVMLQFNGLIKRLYL